MNSLRGAIGRLVPLTSLPEASILRPCPTTLLNRLGASKFTTSAQVLARENEEKLEEKKEEEAKPTSGAHVPLSIQAVYYKPLRRQATHGLPVCNLQIRSYSVRNLEMQADIALRAAYYLGLPASGPVPLPRKIERWTVPRSNFAHKKSQENYERITLSRLIQIKDGHPETVQVWLAFLKKHAFYGVGMKANVWEFEELGVQQRMDKQLVEIDKAPYPKWQSFNKGRTVDTASMVKEILESEEYRVLEKEK